MITIVSLSQEWQILICQHIDCIFFNREKILVLVEQKKHASIDLIEVLSHDCLHNSHLEELRIRISTQSDTGHHVQFFKIQELESTIDEVLLRSMEKVFKETRVLGLWFLRFHVQNCFNHQYFPINRRIAAIIQFKGLHIEIKITNLIISIVPYIIIPHYYSHIIFLTVTTKHGQQIMDSHRSWLLGSLISLLLLPAVLTRKQALQTEKKINTRCQNISIHIWRDHQFWENQVG